mmetsp:Transcript_44631/g.94975  ORF Transcript_44631/g.94975 Transcript_44631/m.94975 type:complete len:627 (+) Transcript_44631:181-2061(+)
MKLLKGPKSLRRKKKSTADGSAGPSSGDASSTPLESQPDSPIADEPTSPVVTPPSSPQEAVSPAGSRRDVPSPSSPSSRSSLSNKNLRPLRLGSFNFDQPDANASVSDAETTPQTRPLAFPPLFHEADDMLNLANLIYTLAELRDLARNGVLNNPDKSTRILDLPMPLTVALQIIMSEGELLREVLDDGKHEATLSALESLLDRQEEMRAQKEDERRRAQAEERAAEKEAQSAHKKTESGMFGWMTDWDGCLAGGFAFDELFCGGDLGMVDPNAARQRDVTPDADQSSLVEPEVESTVITAVGDLKSEEELVYAVGVNPVEERITVIFRGSVTKSDFMTDAKISMRHMLDPRRFHGTENDDSSTTGDVGVHQGFYDYLFGEKDGQQSKYTEIMEHVNELLAEDPDRRNYKLYATGHSLGGALATLFGLYAAASSSVALPVTVVSVASPRVGNLAFARAFAEMESQGKLRHLRIANHKDPVTLGPTVSSKRALALSAKAFSPLGYLALKATGNAEGGDEEVYYHTGMKMKMFKKVSSVSSQRCELSYSGQTIVSGSKKPVAIDNEDMAEIEQSNRRKKKESSAELPMVSYHYGMSYSERMAGVESDLRGLTLNNVYREKAGGMPWVV